MTDQPVHQLGFDDIAAVRVEFKDPLARAGDMDTSAAAARDARVNAGTGRHLVLATLYAHPEGCTDFELSSITGWQQTSIGKRRGECVAAGLVEVAFTHEGVTIKRPSPSGSLAAVWVITQKGRDFVRQS